MYKVQCCRYNANMLGYDFIFQVLERLMDFEMLIALYLLNLQVQEQFSNVRISTG